MQPYPVTLNCLPPRARWLYDDPSGNREPERVIAPRPRLARTAVDNSLHFRVKGHLSRVRAAR